MTIWSIFVSAFFKLILCCLLLSAFGAQAATEHYSVYLNTDNITTGQCTENSVSGIDYRIVISVDNASKTITQVNLSSCNTSAFSSPLALNLSDWSLGTGNGTRGSDLIEGRLPLVQLGSPTRIDIAVVSDLAGTVAASTGATWRGITLSKSVPVLSAPLLAVLMVLMCVVAWRASRRYHTVSGWLLVLCLTPLIATLAWAATIAIDGVDDWNASDLQHTLAAGTRTNGDLRAVYLTSDATNVYLRVDAHIGPVAPRALNDTGIVWGGDYPIGNNAGCTGAVIAAQDCSHGRDAAALAGTLTKTGAGHAGFDFTKLDSSGNDLAASATSWSCVRDNVTELVWEVKTDDGTLHDKDNTYTWYNTDSTNNGGSAGTENGGTNTQAFVAAVNAAGWCGATDWRLPSVEELHSIANLSRTNPAIDTDYFPNTLSNAYWSSSPSAYYSNGAWGVSFDNGNDYYNYKHSSYYVRLVRGGQ